MIGIDRPFQFRGKAMQPRHSMLPGILVGLSCIAGCGSGRDELADATNISLPSPATPAKTIVASTGSSEAENSSSAETVSHTTNDHSDQTLDASTTYVELLRTIADSYLKYDIVNDKAQVAPFLCRAPSPAEQAGARFAQLSNGDDQSPHGRKLYYLFASDLSAYTRTGADRNDGPIGQTLVKEAWTAEPNESHAFPTAIEHASGELVSPFARDGEHSYRAGERHGLFIMHKIGDSHTPGTDNGWIYGTVSADGKHVTSAGRVESCIKCHEQAPHGRLFGLKPVN